MKRLLVTVSSCVLMAQTVQAATTNPLSAPAPGSILTPPLPSPELPRKEAPRLRENLGLPNGEAKVLNFRVSRVRIVGATAIDEGRLAKLFTPILNKPITALDLRAALDRVNKLYDDEGYALGRAFVPVQVMQGGTLIVRVVEGHVGKITIETDSESARSSIERFSRRITAETPLRTATLERYLLLISDLPGIKISGQLTGMDIYTGTATMALKAEYDPYTLDTTVDNRANLESAPFQTYLTGAANGLLGQGEQVALTALATPEIQTQQYYRLAYAGYIGSDGLRATVGASFAKAKSGDLPPAFDFRSRSREVDAALSYPFIRSISENLIGTFGAYVAQADNDLNGLRFSEDAIRAAFADASYTTRLSDTLVVGGSGRLTQGLGILGAGPDDTLHSRLGTRPWFFKARAAANASYALTERLGLSASAEGQYSPHSLYASEEITFGGAHFGRGFDTSETSGDSGYGTSLQAQYRVDTELAGGWTLLPYTFIDQSRVMNKSVDGQGNDRLVSTGIGVTVSNRKWIVVGVEVDKPLNRSVASRGNRDPRLYLSLELRL
jgi:hemolysin activation/secretion protein